MRKLLIFLLLAIIAAKVAGVLARGPVPIELDAFGYWRLSALAMDGDLLMLGEPIAYRTPLYPWLIAVVRAFAGPSALMVISIVQGILGVFSIWIAAHVAARITKLPRAFPWTLAVSLPAVSAYTFSAAVLSETVFVFLLMVNLLAVLDYGKYGTKGRAIWLGITFALALLTRPIVLLLWIPHLLFLLYIHVRKRRRLGKQAAGRTKLHHRVGHMALAAMTVVIVIAPWMMRNQYLFGTPFLTEFVGRNVWVVTFQDGSGAGLDLPDSPAGMSLKGRLISVGAEDEWRATWRVSKALVRSGLNDASADRLMKQVSVDAIVGHPRTFAYKAFRRTINFWRCAATDLPPQGPGEGKFHGQQTWGWEIPPIDWAIEHRWSHSVALNSMLTLILVAANVLLIVNFPTRPYGFWMAFIFVYFAAVTGILEIPAYRYRLVLEPLMAMVIGSAVTVIMSRRRRPAKLAA